MSQSSPKVENPVHRHLAQRAPPPSGVARTGYGKLRACRLHAACMPLACRQHADSMPTACRLHAACTHRCPASPRWTTVLQAKFGGAEAVRLAGCALASLSPAFSLALLFPFLTHFAVSWVIHQCLSKSSLYELLL